MSFAVFTISEPTFRCRSLRKAISPTRTAGREETRRRDRLRGHVVCETLQAGIICTHALGPRGEIPIGTLMPFTARTLLARQHMKKL